MSASLVSKSCNCWRYFCDSCTRLHRRQKKIKLLAEIRQFSDPLRAESACAKGRSISREALSIGFSPHISSSKTFEPSGNRHLVALHRTLEVLLYSTFTVQRLVNNRHYHAKNRPYCLTQRTVDLTATRHNWPTEIMYLFMTTSLTWVTGDHDFMIGVHSNTLGNGFYALT